MFKNYLQKLRQLVDDNALPTAKINWFKGAIEDAKIFSLVALTAQPGDYDHLQIEQVYWRERRIGAAILRFLEMFLEEAKLSAFARIISPRRQHEIKSSHASKSEKGDLFSGLENRLARAISPRQESLDDRA
ncbi:MAG: hypothetical protein GKR90_10545 [Pseudomonadales bacterium]|nr:hypothetical protein [Pseudomonadales bacterium]